MKAENHTVVSEFVFQGFSSFHEHKLTLFVVFLTLYLFTLASNVTIVTIISIDRRLHTPMYFFLTVLSTSETLYTLITVPRMLCNLIGLNQPISLAGCATQMFFFITLAINNCFLLTAMGLPFCDREVAHYFCDIRPVMKLSCADTAVHNIINFIVSSLVIVVPMGLVLISYIFIISTIFKIASAEGRKKAFATCASHLTVVIIHYGCASIAYLRPKSDNMRDQDQLISVTYTVFTPLLNPVVYTLRNKEVKDALHRVIGRNRLA
ncbi:olfactory receptor 10J1-like isoform X2 [Vicugna pacos]|uniref:Olfactory receptor 10J1-like isoform X2 n=1 Tax=Vicugna pacos TaxID=30538 RepID=A0ABM5C175_VICPA